MHMHASSPYKILTPGFLIGSVRSLCYLSFTFGQYIKIVYVVHGTFSRLFDFSCEISVNGYR